MVGLHSISAMIINIREHTLLTSGLLLDDDYLGSAHTVLHAQRHLHIVAAMWATAETPSVLTVRKPFAAIARPGVTPKNFDVETGLTLNHDEWKASRSAEERQEQFDQPCENVSS
jgi:hypothetical protein